MSTSAGLTPPDLLRCQALHRAGGAFSLGPPGEWKRCNSAAHYLVTETEPGADGLTGSMTLCIACFEVFKKRITTHRVELVVDAMAAAQNPSEAR